MASVIPLKDESRRPDHFPAVTALIVIVNALAFVLELRGGEAFVRRWAEVPATIVGGHDWITLLTAMFMHAGWMHIIGNMIFLWAFGPEVEDAMGRPRYLAFYLLSGLAASLAQIAFMPDSTIPNLGASGAIAGVMGAFLVTYPRDQMRALLLFGWWTRIAIIPAALLIGVWFIMQLFDQVGAVVTNVESGGVAYAAHIGGFIFGVITGRVFEGFRRVDEIGA